MSKKKHDLYQTDIRPGMLVRDTKTGKTFKVKDVEDGTVRGHDSQGNFISRFFTKVSK